MLGIECRLVVVNTTGDRRHDVPIHAMGGQGVFVKEVQAAVLDNRADVAVHSAKDLPSAPSAIQAGLMIGAVPERGDPRDALVGAGMADLAPGARVATGSVRRRAQMLGLRPDLVISDLRGNIESRLAKAGQFDAIVMATVALDRLGRSDVISQILEPEVMLPQVAQGALAVECRTDDEATADLLSRVNHEPSAAAVRSERAFLAQLGAGCDAPVGAWARPAKTNSDESLELVLDALVADPDGTRILRQRHTGTDPEALGRAVFALLAAQPGASDLLAYSRSSYK